MARPAADATDVLEWPGVDRAHHTIHALRELEDRLRAVAPRAVDMAMRAFDAKRPRPRLHARGHGVLRERVCAQRHHRRHRPDAYHHGLVNSDNHRAAPWCRGFFFSAPRYH